MWKAITLTIMISFSITARGLASHARIQVSSLQKVCLQCQGFGLVSRRARRRTTPVKQIPKPPLGICRIDRLHPFQLNPKISCVACSGSGVVHSCSDIIEARDDLHHKQVDVAIVGGGLGGLALALALQQRGMTCAVLEKDAQFSSRSQGYGLTLQQGARAARSLGILDDCVACSVTNSSPTGKALPHFSFDSQGSLLGFHGGRGAAEGGALKPLHRQNLLIGRQALRRVLLSRLAPHTVRWNTSLARAVYDHDEFQFELSLKTSVQPVPTASDLRVREEPLNDDGTSSSAPSLLRASVVVGADGIRSTTTAVLSDAVPGIHNNTAVLSSQKGGLEYLGVMIILGIFPSKVVAEAAAQQQQQDSASSQKGPFPFPPQLRDFWNNGGDAGSVDETSSSVVSIFESLDGCSRLYSMPFSRRRVRGVDDSDPHSEPDLGVKSGGGCEEEDQDQKDHEDQQDQEMWQLSFPVTEAEAVALSRGGPKELKAEALKRCGSWHAPLPDLISATPDTRITGYPVYDRLRPVTTARAILESSSFSATSSPSLEKTTSSPTTATTTSTSSNNIQEKYASGSKKPPPAVTLVGDAAHPMAPFKGQGANQALLDALCLAKALFDSELGDQAAHANSLRRAEKVPTAPTPSSFDGGDDPATATTTSRRKSKAAAAVGPRSRCPVATALLAYESEMEERTGLVMDKSRAASKVLHSSAALAATNRRETRAAAAKGDGHLLAIEETAAGVRDS